MANLIEINISKVCPYLKEKNINSGPVIKIDRDLQKVKSDECEVGDHRVTVKELNPYIEKNVAVYQVSCDGCSVYRRGFLDVYPVRV